MSTVGVCDTVPMDADQLAAADAVRREMNSAIRIVEALVPESAERTIVFRKIEEASFYAVKAIARRGQKYLP